MTTNSLIEKLAALESEGIQVTIGEGATFLGSGKSVYMLWRHPERKGWTSRHKKFENYSDMPKAFDEALIELRCSIKKLFQGENI